MKQATDTHPFLSTFGEHRRRVAERGPDWLRRAREAFQARFDEQGLPSLKDERWRGTSVKPIVATEFAPAPTQIPLDSGAIPPLAALDLGGPRLVFLDGRLQRDLSQLPGAACGAFIGTLTEAAERMPEAVRETLTAPPAAELHGFGALTGSLWEDGAAVLVPDGVELSTPVHLIFLSSGSPAPTASFPRTLVSIGREARATVVESYLPLGSGTYLTSALSQATVADAGTLEHHRLQLEAPTAFHVSHSTFRQGRDSRITTHNADLGGRLVRNDLLAILDGEGAHGEYNGVYLTNDEQHVDNHTTLDHARPHGDSRELYKGIVTGRSRAIFNGRIIVRQNAQKTDAKQSNPNLVLGDHALAHTRPQLEIYADDVKCTHGATVGRLDEEAIFYLRTRGLTEAEARNLLIQSFAGEVLERIEIQPLRDHLEKIVAERLRRGVGERV